MSAPILQPGDQITLALPVSGGLVGRERDAWIAEDGLTYTRFYRDLDIEVVGTSHHSQLTAPVVVSVIRRPPTEGDPK